MARVTPAIRAEVRRLIAMGEPSRMIAERLGISKSSVNLVRREPAPPPPEPALELLAEDGVWLAESADEAHELALAELPRVHPLVAEDVTAGETLVTALFGQLHVDPALLYSPEAIAEIAVLATEYPLGVDDAPKGEGRAELDRALKLLERALVIVRRRGVARRWS